MYIDGATAFQELIRGQSRFKEIPIIGGTIVDPSGLQWGGTDILEGDDDYNSLYRPFIN